jgi:hypothetical protein
MVKSVQDCVLYYADRLLGQNKIGGIYCDDTWPQASDNILNHTAYVRNDGEVQPGFAILKQREYTRRLAHLLEDYGKRPGLWIHDTHAFVIPYLAFADISMDGEDHSLTALSPDFIDEWPFERLRAGAMGTKIGTIPFWLPLIRIPKTAENHDTIVKLSRTIIGPLMLHDYITYYTGAAMDQKTALTVQQAKFDFGIGDESVTFHPYWDNSDHVRRVPRQVYVSYYQNGTSLLVTVVNTSRQAVAAELRLDFAAMGIGNPQVTNAETGEAVPCDGGVIRQEMPYHDFVLLRIDDGNAKQP